MPSNSGFLNLRKPAGLTSHDCVARIRRLLREHRVGHGGTLDPAATGVLPIAVGKATRLLRFLPEGKVYRATIRFGVVTATDDLEGEIRFRVPCADLSRERAIALLPSFLGTIEQRPPAFSAIQVGGVRLYQRARAGESVEVPSRRVDIHRINVLAWREGDFPELDAEIACGPGTYIRAIARDLGEKLGCGATLARLERTLSGGFSLADSLTLADIETAIADSRTPCLSPEIALAHLPAINLGAEAARRWCCGQTMALPDALPPDAQIARVFHGEQFLGVGQIGVGGLRPEVVFADPIAVPTAPPTE